MAILWLQYLPVVNLMYNKVFFLFLAGQKKQIFEIACGLHGYTYCNKQKKHRIATVSNLVFRHSLFQQDIQDWQDLCHKV